MRTSCSIFHSPVRESSILWERSGYFVHFNPGVKNGHVYVVNFRTSGFVRFLHEERRDGEFFSVSYCECLIWDAGEFTGKYILCHSGVVYFEVNVIYGNTISGAIKLHLEKQDRKRSIILAYKS